MTALGDFSSGDVLTAADLNAIGAWTAFTPNWTAGLTIGNGTDTWYYAIVNDLMVVQGFTELGSTSSVTSAVRMALPAGRSFKTMGYQDLGPVTIRYAGNSYACNWRVNDTAEVYIETLKADGTYLVKSGTSSTVPASGWGSSGSLIRGTFAAVCS